MNNQKFKVMPEGGSGIDWRGSGCYASTIEKARAAGVKFLQNQNSYDKLMRATRCSISHRKPGTEGKWSQWREVEFIYTNGETSAQGQCYNPLTAEARLLLTKSVAQTVFDNCESFREQHIGADLAYLLIAIVDDNWEHVDWTEQGYGGQCELLKLLLTLYNQQHDVWLYIIK